MDRSGKYTSWRIVENTPARVVLHWRHALVSRNDTLVNFTEDNDLGDWVDDYYTIYPNTVCARRTVLHSCNPKSNHSYAQDNSVLQPGLMAWDIYEREPLSVANLVGQETLITMGKGHDGPKDKSFQGPGEIQLHNFAAKWKPFMISPPGEIFRGEWTNQASWPWNLPSWHHWPTAQLIDSDGSNTFVENGRPKSSCVTNGYGYGAARTNYDAVELTDNKMVRWSLIGMTDQSASALAPLARAWRQPPAASVTAGAFQASGFSLDENAFHFKRQGEGGALTVNIAASEENPLVNPALVIKDWHAKSAQVLLGGEALPAADYKTGFLATPAGTDLVLWVEREFMSAVSLEIKA